MQEMVVLVDEKDNAIGTMEKLQAHKEGRLHRAISVFLFNDQGQMLLQQRAHEKYHSGGLWTNTCCSHPRVGEVPADAAKRRLNEEMGISTDLHKIFDFIYRSSLDRGLIEHEFDHVFVGLFNNIPQINPKEACSWAWVSTEKLKSDISKHPERYTTWFKLIHSRVISICQTIPILSAGLKSNLGAVSSQV